MRRSGPALLTLLICVTPTLARADAAQARAHFQRGRTYYEVDEYLKAIDEFKAAHLEKADPAYLYNIAECYRRLGDRREALVYYRRYLASAPARDRTRPLVEKRIAELQAAEAQAKAAPPVDAGTGAATVVVAPPPRETPPAVTLVREGAPEPAPEPRPLYRRGWFWVTLSVVAIAGGVGVWALTRGTDAPDTPLGNRGVF